MPVSTDHVLGAFWAQASLSILLPPDNRNPLDPSVHSTCTLTGVQGRVGIQYYVVSI